MTIRSDEIIAVLRREIENFSTELKTVEAGGFERLTVDLGEQFALGEIGGTDDDRADVCRFDRFGPGVDDAAD